MRKKIFVYVASYGPQYWTSLTDTFLDGKGEGVTVYSFDDETGALSYVGEVKGLCSPATLVVSPDQKYLYAANETRDYPNAQNERGLGGGVIAFSIHPETGNLKVLNDSLSYGCFPSYISIDKEGRYLLLANHGSYFYSTKFIKTNEGYKPEVIRDDGSISLFSVVEDGGIGQVLDIKNLRGTGADPMLHASAHPHSVAIDEFDYVIAPNKGGDNIFVYKLNRDTNELEEKFVCPAAYGSSPRHVAFCKDTPWVMVINEFDAHLGSYHLNRETGELTQVQIIDTVDRNFSENTIIAAKSAGGDRPWACDVQVHPNGRFVYTTNTQNMTACFELDRSTGRLTLQGRYPVGKGMTRGIQIDRTGRWMITAGLMDDALYVTKIDPETGALSYAGSIESKSPTAVRFVYL